MKVLLVNTNLMKPPIAPIGLDYLADSILAAGHEASLLDLCFSTDTEADIEAACRAAPDIIGCTIRNTDDCFFASGAFFLPGIREIIHTLREHSDAPVALGGVGFSLMPEAVVEYCGADFGIAGEGEESFVQLLGALGGASDLEQVPGLVFWDEGGLQRNRPVDSLLDRLPVRTRSFLDNRRYFAQGGQAGFETKRGCPMTCVYCADPVSKGKRSRLLPPRRVVDELQRAARPGHRPHAHVRLRVQHPAAARAGGLPGRHRRGAGGEDPLVRVLFGGALRRGDRGAAPPRRLRRHRLRRGQRQRRDAAEAGTALQHRRTWRQTARICRDAGIPFMYDLLLGGPGETGETARESLALVRKADPDCIGISVGVRVYDGTPLAEQVRGMGPLEANPALHGARMDNERLLRPLFYLSPEPRPGPACARAGARRRRQARLPPRRARKSSGLQLQRQRRCWCRRSAAARGEPTGTFSGKCGQAESTLPPLAVSFRTVVTRGAVL